MTEVGFPEFAVAGGELTPAHCGCVNVCSERKNGKGELTPLQSEEVAEAASFLPHSKISPRNFRASHKTISGKQAHTHTSTVNLKLFAV